MKLKKTIVSIGTVATISLPLMTSVSMSTTGIHNKKWTLNPSSTNRQKMDYYFAHKQELDEYIKPIYKDISKEAENNQVYLEWVKKFNPIQLKSKTFDDVKNSIFSLKMSFDLRLFLVQNFIDKVIYNRWQDKNGLIRKRSASTSKTYSEFNQANALWTLNDVTYETETPWDRGSKEGAYDPISHMYFSENLKYIYNAGWNDDDADSAFRAYKVKVEFYNTETHEYKHFYLHYNAAQDTDWANEDYAFVGISSPESVYDYSHYYGSAGGPPSYPAIGGIRLTWDKIKPEATAHQDNKYTMSYHETDYGGDDEWGNYLKNLPIKQSPLNGREGNGALNNLAHDVVKYAYEALNVEDSPKFVDKHYLYTDNEYTIADQQLVLDDNSKIKISGKSTFDDLSADTNYHAFAADETYIWWSNQDIWSHYSKYIRDEFLNKISENVKAKDGESLEDKINKLFKEQLKISDLEKTLELLQESPDTGKDYSGSDNNHNKEAMRNVRFIQTAVGFALGTFTGALGEFASVEKGFEEYMLSIGAGNALPTLLDISNYKYEGKIDWGNELMSFATGFGLTFAGMAIGSLLGPLGTVVGAAIGSIAHFLITYDGNDHSTFSNMFDHGLNDWDYQMKNNTAVMYQNALNWSENLTKGIEYNVEDSWIHYPDLFIRTQGDSTWKNLSDKDQFNYGEMIPVTKKGDFSK